jgi:hypothetical protein
MPSWPEPDTSSAAQAVRLSIPTDHDLTAALAWLIDSDTAPNRRKPVAYKRLEPKPMLVSLCERRVSALPSRPAEAAG